MTKTQQISAMILTKLSQGMSIKDAVNAVLGTGRYEALASDLYDNLRKGA
jgi:hypothetical protein